MDTQSAEAETVEIEQYPFVLGSVLKSKSGAEMLTDWNEQGCFKVWAEQYKDIGLGEKYIDSTEYVQAIRERADYRGKS